MTFRRCRTQIYSGVGRLEFPDSRHFLQFSVLGYEPDMSADIGFARSVQVASQQLRKRVVPVEISGVSGVEILNQNFT